ncbi:diguanylate cyclase [Metabacillus litoralis]|uniref:Diguanylate cyclase n=1 Tax=Metabacillus litoralis TaxID=152268 RepID=A0A5C6W223_9BACI|nr:GGDEF domain-containing protein [Metabacillus litoralis]TXC89772.1 diguanylate cyclase [Metabacillus litoralis]
MHIVRDLFININILVALIFVYSQLIDRKIFRNLTPFTRKIVGGVASGILGVILMQFSIQVTSDTIVDLRHVPILLSMIYSGTIPAIISAIVIIIARFFIGFNLSSIVALLYVVVVTIGFYFIRNHKMKRVYKVFWMLFYANTIFSFVISYLVPEWNVLKTLVPIFWILSIVGGLIGYYFSEHLRKTHKLFQHYKAQSTKDFLTGLRNVRYFNEKLMSIIEDEHVKEHSLLYLDIDHFKKVNDTYGHNEGDEVLKQISNIMVSLVRPIDSCYRKGGEEFSIILPNSPLTKAEEIAERIRRAVELHPFKLTNGKVIFVTISIGISHFPSISTNGNELVEFADEALYLSKNSGRNKVSIATKKRPA